MRPLWQKRLELGLFLLCNRKFGKHVKGIYNYGTEFCKQYFICSFNQENFYKENTTWPHNTKLDYRCPPGKAFKLQDGSNTFIDSITLECGWDKSWTWDPSSNNGQLLPCECKKIWLYSNPKISIISKHRHTLHWSSCPSCDNGYSTCVGRKPGGFQLRHWIQMSEGAEIY